MNPDAIAPSSLCYRTANAPVKLPHETVFRSLTDSRATLNRLAQVLLEEEIVKKETLAEILGPRPTLEEKKRESQPPEFALQAALNWATNTM